MEHKIVKLEFENVISKIKKYIKDENELEKIKIAYNFSVEKYKDRKRLTNQNYINHALNVVEILTTIYADCDTLILGLIHDIEPQYIDSIKNELGSNMYELYLNFQQIDDLNFNTTSLNMTENYKKILIGICKDVRIITVKLAEILHNMRTLWVVDEETQKMIAKTNLEIFTPIAHRLGIQKLKGEIEDLSLRYLKPEVYYDIVEELNATKVERDKMVNSMIDEVSLILNEEEINHKIKGRSKSIYSIYKKLDKGKTFSTIYDLFAIRIIVETKEECYAAIGYLHSKFKPMPGRFKDYIAMPKSNMYQSIHSTVFGVEGTIFEIQIRTHEMDRIAELGIANHWSYKENSKNTQNVMDEKLKAFRTLIEKSNDEIDNEDFISYIKEEIFDSNIYVYTPMGDIIELPKGAVPIDFAYKVHSKVGDKMVGAIVNNLIVPLDHELKSNDIVKIITNPNSKGPSKRWINMAKTSQAKSKIKSFFTKKDKEIYLKEGEEELLKALRKAKIPFDLYKEKLDSILEEYCFIDEKSLFLNIGSNKILPQTIIKFINKEEIEETPIINNVKVEKVDSTDDIIVQGIDNIKINIANCCNPIPGDKIVGYIQNGKGINIHRTRCHNIIDVKEKLIEVEWNKNTNKKYKTQIIVYSNCNTNILTEIVSKTSNSNILIENLKTLNENGNLIYEISLLTNSLENLNSFLIELKTNKNITDAQRIIK